MHVTRHALCGRDLRCELMLDRMTGLILRNARIGRFRRSLIPGRRILAGRRDTGVVRVDHMTRRAPRRAIIAGMIVRSEKVQCRIHQTRLLDSEKNRIGRGNFYPQYERRIIHQRTAQSVGEGRDCITRNPMPFSRYG